jgi:hypothetical protein
VNGLLAFCADAMSGPSPTAQPHTCRPEQLHWTPLAHVAMQDRVSGRSSSGAGGGTVVYRSMLT